jgi:hypothetical protein
MRIFTRYILREVISYAALGGVLFTFVLFMRNLNQILDLLVRDSASLTDTFRLFADMLPNTLTVTIPTAVDAGHQRVPSAPAASARSPSCALSRSCPLPPWGSA